MKLKMDRNVYVYIILICIFSKGFGRSVDLQDPTYDTSEGSDQEDVEDDSDDIDQEASRGQSDLDQQLNKLYNQLLPESLESSQPGNYSLQTKQNASRKSPDREKKLAVINPSNIIPENYVNLTKLQNGSNLGSVDASVDSGQLKTGNSSQPTFVKTFKTVNLIKEPIDGETGRKGEYSYTHYEEPGEDSYHDSSASQLDIGESVETHKNNLEKTKIVPGANGLPKKLKVQQNEVKQIFHWNSKTTPSPRTGFNRRSQALDLLLEKIQTIDEDVINGEKYLATKLDKVKQRMRTLQDETAKFQPLDEDSASFLINNTLTAAEEAIWSMCIQPIREQLRVPNWSDWSPWGTCTLTCGKGGYRLRHRSCLSESQRRCLGNSFDIMPCDMEICPAIWLSWGHWSHCSASCNHGLKVRTRTCLTSNIKLNCMGSTAEVKDCFDQKCPVPMRVSDKRTSNDQKRPVTDHRLADYHLEEMNFGEPATYGKSSYHGAKGLRGKARKGTMLSVNRGVSSENMDEKQVPHATNGGPVWSSWTGWSLCKDCNKSNRDRKRICLNGTSHLPVESFYCSGADRELSPCSAPSCPLEREFPSAPRISEGGKAELKCDVKSNESPERVYWITPRTRHVMYKQPSRRVFMVGTSLVVTKARFSDQGKYRCVLMFEDRQPRVKVAPLIVETCADHPCENGGECLTSPDPDFDSFKHYQCKCPPAFKGSLCQNSLRGNKLIAPIIISVLCLIIAFAFCLFLVIRSVKKSKENNLEGSEKHWKKKKSGDNSDVTNTSVVSNDDSFVEVTAEDLDDYDHYEMPHEGGSGGYYKTEEGYLVSPLKYPSPRQKLTYGLVSQDDEQNYLEMESLPEHKRHTRKIKFDVPHSEEAMYENMGRSVAGGGKPSPQKRNRPTTEEVIDIAAEEIAQKCLRELHNQRAGQAMVSEGYSKPSPNVSDPYRQSPSARESRTPTRVSQSQARQASPSPAPGTSGYRVPATGSPSYDDDGYPISKIVSVKDKQQETEFLKHFGGSMVPKMQSPSTSTPKKEHTLSGKKVILPSDIIATPKEDLTVNKVKKNLAKDLMMGTTKNVVGQQEQNPAVRDQRNISNNGHTQATPSESEILYEEPSYHLVDPQNDFSSRQESFLSANSTSLRTLPDVDGTISFPKLSGEHVEEEMGDESGNQYYNTQSFMGAGLYSNNVVYPQTEESMYLSDYHYTPDPSELYISPSSNPQYSEEEDVLSESGSSSNNSSALRYQPNHQ